MPASTPEIGMILEQSHCHLPTVSRFEIERVLILEPRAVTVIFATSHEPTEATFAERAAPSLPD